LARRPISAFALRGQLDVHRRSDTVPWPAVADPCCTGPAR